MNYHNITHCDMKNGDGLRVVLWVSGCTHHCKGCHNPQTWDPDSGILFDADAETELWDELDKDYISGITFSGGDPLAPCNIETVSRLIRYIRARYGNSKTIWVYTGYTIEELLAKNLSILKCIDVIVDGEYVEELRDTNLEWRGSSNQRVIRVKEEILDTDPENADE